MSTTPSQDAADLRSRARTSRSKVASRLLDQPLRNLGVGGAFVILASTAAFGGLEPAAPTEIDGIELGAAISAAPFDVTLTKVLWVDELPGASLSDDDNRWLAILATLTSTADESVADPAIDVVTLSGVDGLVGSPVPGTDRVVSDARLVLADGSQPSPLQPGLDYDVVFLFEQSGDAPAPVEVLVQVAGHTRRAGSLDGSLGWFDPAVVAQGLLPMREAVDESAATAADGPAS